MNQEYDNKLVWTFKIWAEAAVTLNGKVLYHDRRIKINQKRPMNC